MRYMTAVLSLTAISSQVMATDVELVLRQDNGTANGTIIQICPNQHYQGIEYYPPVNGTLDCMNISNPNRRWGYGQSNCFSLTYTPLMVGSPQGISSARLFGTQLNCTLYKTANCLPDNPDNGYIIPATGAATLPLPTASGDPKAMDDMSQAFECR